MAISIPDCTSIVEELQAALTGGWIQKIHQPQPHTLTFDIRVPGDTFTLVVCAESQFARLHLTSKKLENPPTPPPFCQFLRAQLEGGRIEQVHQEPDDRIVYVTIRTSAACFVLVVAMTGRQANVFLLNEQRLILKSLKPARSKVGELYKPPSISQARSPSTSDPAQSHQERVELGTLRASIIHQQSLPPQTPPHKGDDFFDRFPVSATLEARYSKLEAESHTVTAARARIGTVHKAIKKGQRQIRALEHDLEKAERFREYHRYGELLKAKLPQLKRGQDQTTVIDYYDPALPELVIPLDSSRDPNWNMEDYFRKHRKYLSAQEHLKPRLETALKEVERLKKELDELKKSEFEDLVGISPNPTLHSKTSAASLTLSPKGGEGTNMLTQSRKIRAKKPADPILEGQKKRATVRAKPYRKFESFDGIPILVGKSAKDNDALTLNVAKPDDLWLHARGTPGSHVVVRLDKGVQVSHETLRDAAALALWYSDLRKSGKGEVIYTYRKFVKKGKGLKPGAVMVEREKSVWIEVKPDRLERLKGTTR